MNIHQSTKSYTFHTRDDDLDVQHCNDVGTKAYYLKYCMTAIPDFRGVAEYYMESSSCPYNL